MAKIFFISGLADIEIRGNQTMKNTIKYLSEFDYKIRVLTFRPSDYPNLLNPKDVFNSNVEFHRLPIFLLPIVHLGQRLKDSLGRWRLNKKAVQTSNLGETVEYYGEYNFFGRFLFIVFLFLFYLPIEFLRALFFYFKDKPDIFYGFNCQGGVLVSLLGKIFHKPTIARYQGTGIKEENLKSWIYRLSVLDEIIAMKVPFDAFIMNEDGSKGDRILKLFGVEESKIYFWMNGLDTENLTLSSDWSADEFKQQTGLAGKKIILMVSRLALWKRVDRGVYCVAKLVKEYNLKNFKLLIVGEGPEREKLENLSEKLGLKDKIQFLGGIAHKEVYKYYAISDIFLTLYDIGNRGNPTYEAMYFSLPIVTLDDGSTADLLVNSYNSLLVRLENIKDELPAKVKMLLENESMRKNIGRKARETFEKKILSWKERMKLENDVIRNLLSKKKIE